MCSVCVDAVKTTFPEYAHDDEFLNFILWEKTAFPFADAQYVAQQVFELRKTFRPDNYIVGTVSDGEGI